MVSGCSGWIRMVSGWCLKFELKIFVNYFSVSGWFPDGPDGPDGIFFLFKIIIINNPDGVRMVRMVRMASGWCNFYYINLEEILKK